MKAVRWLGILIGIFALVALVLGGIITSMSESGEVVVLRTFDREGEPYETRLWIVEHDGAGWLRAGQAESVWFRQMGWSVVNMTGYPEAVLAAEAGLAYATVALVTDYDAGVDGYAPVTMEAVLDVMRSNVSHLRDLLTRAIPSIA